MTATAKRAPRGRNQGSKRGELQLPDGADGDRTLMAFYDAGASLQEVASVVGVSRERVRQRVERIRGGTAGRGHRINGAGPLESMRAIRAASVTSWEEAGRFAGHSGQGVRAVAHELGVGDAAKRLFRWRRSHRQRSRLTGELRALIARLGRVPVRGDMRAENGVTNYMNYKAVFGSWRAALATVGCQPRAGGKPGHRASDARALGGAA